MTELERFIKSVEGRSVNTIKTYKNQYLKLYKLLGKDISETSEAKLLDIINEMQNTNQKQATLNIGLQLRRLEGLSVKKLEASREINKQILKEDVKDTNRKLQNTLPTYNEIVDYMNNLYDSSAWTDYIINYLLINYQVRNVDLLFDIVKLKRLANDKTKNYMWLGPYKATYIRNVYKTAGTYGKKVFIITDAKFLTALKRVIAHQKNDEYQGEFIPNENQLGYYIQKATYKAIGEGNYFKVIVNQYRNDLDKIKEISDHRGTKIQTILDSYDIENV